MKSIIVNQEQKPEYPCLKISVDTGNIFLLTAPATGTCVFVGNDLGLVELGEYGEYSADWADWVFKHFNGTLQLSN